MNCDEVQSELVAWHLGVVSEKTRFSVDAHLLGCSDCLKSYLTLKRAIETGEDAPCPPQHSKARLRRAIAAELRPPERAWAWWERPLAFAVAGSALVASMFAMQVMTAGPGAPPHGMPQRVQQQGR